MGEVNDRGLCLSELIGRLASGRSASLVKNTITDYADLSSCSHSDSQASHPFSILAMQPHTLVEFHSILFLTRLAKLAQRESRSPSWKMLLLGPIGFWVSFGLISGAWASPVVKLPTRSLKLAKSFTRARSPILNSRRMPGLLPEVSPDRLTHRSDSSNSYPTIAASVMPMLAGNSSPIFAPWAELATDFASQSMVQPSSRQPAAVQQTDEQGSTSRLIIADRPPIETPTQKVPTQKVPTQKVPTKWVSERPNPASTSPSKFPKGSMPKPAQSTSEPPTGQSTDQLGADSELGVLRIQGQPAAPSPQKQPASPTKPSPTLKKVKPQPQTAKPNRASRSPAGQSQSTRSAIKQSDPELGSLLLQASPGLSARSGAQVSRLEPQPDPSDPELGKIRLLETPDPAATPAAPPAPPQPTAPAQTAPVDQTPPTTPPPDDEAPPPEQAPPAPPKPPSVFLLTRLNYFRSSNVFAGIDPVNDGFIQPGLTLFASPKLGPSTYFIGSIDTNLVRYTRLSSVNYDELQFRAGIYQRLSPRMAAELGWTNQRLFNTKEGLRTVLSGERFLNDHVVRLELSRQDPLSKKLSLNTFYQARASFSNPVDRGRLINAVVASLNYKWSEKLQSSVDYQFVWTHFTQQPRDDLFNQISARVSYAITPKTQASLFSGYGFGRSSDKRINFGSFVFGTGVTFNLPLF